MQPLLKGSERERELAADTGGRCDAAEEKGRKRDAVGTSAWMKLKV